MATNKFQTILKTLGMSSSKFKASAKKAVDWFETMAKLANSGKAKSAFSKSKGPVDSSSIGRLFLFSYDPKTKATLPFYDRMPLVFPIEFYADGFLGINMHYLPPVLRARLMDALYDTINTDETPARLDISYRILAGASRYEYFKPCVKRYLFSHMGSSMMPIDPQDWDIAMILPTERFAKATNSQVWADSRGKV